MIKKIVGFLIVTLLVNVAFATPNEVILVRHADKWLHPSSKWKNHHDWDLVLSPKGVVRSVLLAQYIIKNFGQPDYVFAADPIDTASHTSATRALATAGPIVSMLAKLDAKGFRIYYPFRGRDINELAHALLTEKQYDKKTILVIWDHQRMLALVHNLGAKQQFQRWPRKDFDSVFVLKYGDNGQLSNVQYLHNQYPIDKEVTWDDIANLGKK